MFPTQWLKMTTLAEYKMALETKASGTAIAVAILDVRGPADWNDELPPDPVEHWCLTHYLIDGHHKLNAARRWGSRYGCSASSVPRWAFLSGVALKEW